MSKQQQAQGRTQSWKRTTCQGVSGSIVSLVLLCLLLFSSLSYAQQTAKSVEGKVLASGAAPLPGAIVYLQDEKTSVIRTLIATADGGYRFTQLPADTDYQVWAEYKGKKSKVRLVSSFDTKRNVTYDFHISDK